MKNKILVLTILFSVFFAGYAFAQEECNNGVDDDGDGLVDCDDPDCQYASTIEKGCNCADGIDNDGDGYTDIYDSECANFYGLTFVSEDSDCTLPPPDDTETFDFIDPVTTGQNTVDTQSKMAIGDVDCDGIPDVVATSKWNKSIRVIATTDNQADGSNKGDIKSEIRTPDLDIFPPGAPGAGKQFRIELEVLIADINGDCIGEIFAIASRIKGANDPPTEFFLIAFEYSAGTLTPLYDAVELGPTHPGIPAIADFDGDGKAEIYFKNSIYAAETGALLAQGTGDWSSEVNAAPVAVDILPGTSNLELITGNIIYNVPDLSNRNPATPANLTVAKDLNDLGAAYYPKEMYDPVEYGTTNFSSTSVADMNGDGNLDIVLSGANGSPNGNTAIFYWDVTNNTYSVYEPADPVYPGGWPWGTGRPNLADLDGDGDMDINFIAGNQLFALTLDGSGNLIELWDSPRTINDSRSGIVATTVYDFNNDGQPELVYRDSQQLTVIDGATGQDVQWATPCQSHTWTEGPIIADINGDGSTDIVVPCNFSNAFDINDPIQQQALGEIRIYNSSENNWLPTRQVWNQSGYFVVNVKDDLTIPTSQFNQTTVFSEDGCSNGIPGPVRPFNTFMNQVPTIGADGCPFFPAPDVSFVGDDPNAEPGDPDYVDPDDPSYFPAVDVIPPVCGDLEIEVEFNLINNGALTINSTIPVSFWDGDPTIDPPPADPATLLHQEDIQLTDFKVGDTLHVSGVTFNSTGKAFRLYIVLNDDGSALPAGNNGSTIEECDIDNNVYYFDIVPDPFEVTIEKIQDNLKCEDSAPDNGELRSVVTRNGVEVSDYSDFSFQWYDGADTTNAIPAPDGTSDVITGLAEGDYTVVVTDNEKGCASLPADTSIVRIGVDPEITIVENSPQSHCDPPNGELEAFITGGNEGYTFEWFDRFLNPIGITGAVASNLEAGEYIVSVFKDGCTKTASFTLSGPVFPVVSTSVLNHVVDCENLESGKLTAQASISGVPQDSTDYTFTWYKWDTTANDLGSVLAPEHGSGPTRYGLLPGEYAVIALDETTGCESDPPVREIIEDQTQYPDIVVSELEPQTSCDPDNPNGKLIADASLNGVSQDPATLTFEWFEGDNTLPENLITTVSGVNGEIAEGIANKGLPYTVKVTTGNNCAASLMDASMTENLEIPVVNTITFDNTICDPSLAAGGAFNGRVETVSTLSGDTITDFSDYSFTWYKGDGVDSDSIIANNSPDGDILYNLEAGRYTVVLERISTSCVSDPVTVEIFDVTIDPTILLSEVPATNCIDGSPNGQLSASVDESGTPVITGYDFNWYEGVDVSGSGTPVANVSGTNDEVAEQLWGDSTYTVLVINDETGCTNTRTEIVTDDSQIPVLSLAKTDNTVCDTTLATVSGYNGLVNADVTDRGTAVSDFTNYTFEWFDGSATSDPALTSTNPDGDELQGVPGGFYTARVTNDSLGCISDPLTIEVMDDPTIPAITANATPSTNCDPALANGSVQVTDVDGAGTGSPYFFEWYDGSDTSGSVQETGPVYNNLQGGPTSFFTVEVTNQDDGCRNTETLQVADNRELPVLSLTSTPNTICDPSLTDPSVNYDGTATATVTNLIGDIADYEFTWTDDETSTVISGTTGPDLIERDSSDYTATVEHLLTGCISDPATVRVSTNLDIPDITTIMVPSTNCDPALANGQAEVTDVDGLGAGAPYIYQWHDGLNTNTQLAGETNALLDNRQGGSNAYFTVLVTNENNGCQNTATELIADQRVIPQYTLATTPNTICDPASTNPSVTYDGTVSATITNQGAIPITDYEFTWTDEETGTVVFGPETGGGATPGEILTERDSSIYSLVIEQLSTGCVSTSSSAEVTVDFFIPVIDISETPQTSCDTANPNGMLAATIDETLIGGGTGVNTGYVFDWHETSSVSGDAVTTTTATNGEVDQLPGNVYYSVEVIRDATGCRNTESVFLDENIVIPSASLVASPQTFCSPPDGEIIASVTPVPSQTYTFYWLKEEPFTTTTDPSTVITEVDADDSYPNRKFTAGTNVDTDTHSGLYYGDYTMVVVDDYTTCISSTVTATVEDETNAGIAFSALTRPSSCAEADGELELKASRVDDKATDFTFDVYLGGPTNTTSPIDFNENPPTFDDDLNDGSPQPLIGFPQYLGPVPSDSIVTRDSLASNMYSVVITDDFGCQNLETFFLPFIDAHEIDLITSNSQICPYTIGDGLISVRAIQPPSDPNANQSDFTFRFYNGGVANAANLIPDPGTSTDPFISGPEICDNGIDDDGDGSVDGADGECNPPFTPYSSEYTWPPSLEDCADGINDGDPDCTRYLSARNLPPGIYTVEIQENLSGSDCKVYEIIEIERDALDPVVSLVDMDPNTACDLSAADGQFTFNVDKNSNDLVAGTTYDINVTYPPDTNSVTNPSYPIAAQPAGDYDALDLAPNTYTVSVTASTGCTATRDYTILDVPAIATPAAEITDAEYCDPTLEASARIEITDLDVSGVSDDAEDYTFEWYTDAALSSVVQASSAGNNGGDGGEVLTNNGSPTSPITTGSYYVVATKVLAGSTGGVGCESAPLKADIGDKTVNPVATLEPFGDTSCDGVNFEGSIEITATTDDLGLASPPYTNPGASGTYEYIWSAPPTLIPDSNGNNGNAVNDGDADVASNLSPGTYSLRIINESTGCFVSTSTSIQDISPPVFTMTAISSPQELCSPDGSITVTDTQLDAVSEGGTGNFDFNWFEDDPDTPPLEDGSSTVITVDQIDNTNYSTIGSGTYYVVAIRRPGVAPGSGCSSAPLQVNIDEEIIYPDVTLTPFSNTACDANYEGSITIDASDSGGPGAGGTYTYDWPVAPTPIASTNNNDGNSNSTPNNLQDGTYQIRVTNEVTSCITSSTATILNVTTPIIVASATPTDQAICAPDGSIEVTDVQLDGVSEPATDLPVEYTYTWTRDQSSNPPLEDNLGTPIDGILLTTGTNAGEYPDMGAGTYFVSALRNSGEVPGSGCESAPFRVEVEDVSIDPFLTLSTTANENCDLSFANGSISAIATTDGIQGPSYSFRLTSTTLGAPIDSTNNDATVDFIDLEPGSFNVFVVDDNTQCTFSRDISIDDKPVYVDVNDVFFTVNDQEICAPDGSIVVTDVNENGVPQPLGDYNFTWYDGESNLNNNNPVGVNDSYLDNTNYATIGAGTYFFTVFKSTGTTDPGQGCESAPLRGDIEDISTDPNVDFDLFVNTSCDIANPNGEVIAYAFENDGTNTDTYTFDWSYNDGALPGSVTQNDSVSTSTLSTAPDGEYTLTVINTSRTQCAASSVTNLQIDLTISEPNIIVVDVTDPLNCFPTGELEVTEIQVGGQPANVNDFEYLWYEGNFTPGDLILDSLGNPVTSSQLSGQFPDTYFVIAMNFLTACESDPKEAVIQDGDIRYPNLYVNEIAPQTSCDPAQPNAALQATVDGGNDDSNPNYEFEWFNSQDVSGPVYATTSSIYGLPADVFSVIVRDLTTNCTADDYYYTADAVEKNRPIASVAASPKLNCVYDDGSVSAQVLNMNGNFAFDWYIGSTVGSTVDFNGPTFTGLPDGFYTVTVTELDTTFCTSDPVVVEVKDERMDPDVTVSEDNPLTNCWSDRPNGQFSANVDGRIGGYTFEWYNSTDTTGAADFTGSTYVGLGAQTYSLVVTNDRTLCKSLNVLDISDNTVTPPSPDPVVVQHLKSCLDPDGWVRASVDGNVINYFFDWYDGPSVGNIPDREAINYRDLYDGEYTVTAQDIFTGCISEGETVEVLDQRNLPEFDFNVKPAHCEVTDGMVEIVWLNDVQIGNVIWVDPVSGGQIDQGSSLYNYPDGIYGVIVTSIFGCEAEGEVEIPVDILEFNGISANNDGRNDVFEIACINLFPNNHIKIYNRSGQLVYEEFGYNNADKAFTGVGEKGVYLMGKELPDGTYFYIIDKGDGSDPVAGYLELIR